MFSLLSGAILLGGSTTGLWYFRPRGGTPHPLVQMPLLDSVIPMSIVSGFGVGVALVVAAVAELAS